ncbi:MAG: hypothetical protein EOO60_13140 [Hymenobacter sp.]|nr:MAG: hypothetical protein EOO60_13140 [Hymenobacter sp.]
MRQLRALAQRQAQEFNIKKSRCLLQAQALHDRQPMSRYHFIEAQRNQYLVRLLCQVVEIPTSGYYAWQQAQELAANE